MVDKTTNITDKTTSLPKTLSLRNRLTSKHYNRIIYRLAGITLTVQKIVSTDFPAHVIM